MCSFFVARTLIEPRRIKRFLRTVGDAGLYMRKLGVALFVFGIKFREAKQIVVALITTTLNALLTIAKASVRRSGCERNTGNIYDLLGHILIHESLRNI